VGMDLDRHDRRTETDAALVMQVRAGHTSAFDELVRRYQPALSRVARSRLGRADWAEDVVQESFLAAYKSCASYDPRYSFRTWLWTILLHQCYHHHARRSRQLPQESLSSDRESSASDWVRECSGGSPLDALLTKERNDQLERLLTQLSAPQADALRLRFFGELKFYEIAEAMQCSLNTAKNRVRQGLIKMAELLEAAAENQAVRRGSRLE
jgi:RNA polymerase sigma-70 factor (ECF subfamily)